MGYCEKLPDCIRRILEREGQEITIGRSQARVLRGENCFLKIDEPGRLRRAAVMQECFAKKGFSAPLIAYESLDEGDYLLAEEVKGPCALDLLDQPEALSEQLGQAVRALHETDFADCPLQDVNERAVALYKRETGKTIDASLLKKDALVQGDCCLPNIFLGEKAAFIDLGEGGAGDRHFDLYWVMWSLSYNLKTDRYNERFLASYGLEAVEPERLKLCSTLSALR